MQSQKPGHVDGIFMIQKDVDEAIDGEEASFNAPGDSVGDVDSDEDEQTFDSKGSLK